MNRLPISAWLLACALPAAAQSVPATNYTDMWYGGEAESGWGISFAQHAGTGQSNQVFAVWYTYDPREAETNTAEAADFKPLWLVMPGGTWTTPTSITGDVYVTVGTPHQQPWNSANSAFQRVGTFTFSFTSASAGSFTYAIAPPSGLAAGNPAFGLPAFTGTKAIQRQSF